MCQAGSIDPYTAALDARQRTLAGDGLGSMDRPLDPSMQYATELYDFAEAFGLETAELIRRWLWQSFALSQDPLPKLGTLRDPLVQPVH